MVWKFIMVVFIMVFLSGCTKSEKELVIYLSLLPSEEKIYRTLIEDFQEQTGIKTKLISQQYVQIRQAVESEAEAGRGVVDVFEVDVYYLKSMSRFAHDITGLEDYFGRNRLYRQSFNAGRIEGKLLFVPHRISCQAVIYNSEYIKTPPATWEEYRKIAHDFPQRIGLKASLYEGLVCDIFPIVWTMGGDVLDLDDEGTREALHFFKSLSGLIHPGSKVFKENSIVESQAREEIYLHFNWPFAVSYLKEKGLFPKPNRAAPMPGGKTGASVLGGGYLAISKVSPKKKEAEEFLKFIERKDAQEFLLKRLGWFPARYDVWDSLDEVSRKDLSGFIESLQHVRIRPAIGNYEKISQLWQRIFYSLVFKGTSVDAVVEQYGNEMISLLDERK